MIATGMTYPLLDATRYDDEHGEGYAYAAIADDIPVNGVYVADCWIVDREGRVHPGYDAVPVPILAVDLHTDAGFSTVMPERERRGGGWG